MKACRKKRALLMLVLICFVVSLLPLSVRAAVDPRQPVYITFDLRGGEAPFDNAEVFDVRETLGRYGYRDTVPEDEFLFFRDVIPVHPEGNRFAGWRLDVYDDEHNCLGGHIEYTAPDAVSIDWAERERYNFEFVANWDSIPLRVGIDFDLRGGSAPDDPPNIFERELTQGTYKFGDTVDASEFDYFRDVRPLKQGSLFDHWELALLDDGAELLSAIGEYTHGQAVPLTVMSLRYVFRFTARWQDEYAGWVKRGTSWYYYKDGRRQTGWLKDGGKWYYLKPASGAMATGWFKLGASWYYADKNGVMQTGWLKEGGKWYYLKPVSGALATGWFKVDTSWYYADKNGVMQTGWLKEGGKWYYLKPASGALATGWFKVDTSWYYADKNGVMQTGWLKDGGKWYYLKPASGVMATGRLQIGGKWYRFAATGELIGN